MTDRDPPEGVEYDPADFQLDHHEAIAAIIELRGYATEPHRPDPEAGLPAYAHTVGLEDLVGHPELCVVGLDGELADRLFETFVDHLRGGGELPVGQAFVGLLGPDLPAALLPVDVDTCGDMFATIADHYGHRPFRLLQLVYPDGAGRLPWDDDADPSVVAAQLILSR